MKPKKYACRVVFGKENKIIHTGIVMILRVLPEKVTSFFNNHIPITLTIYSWYFLGCCLLYFAGGVPKENIPLIYLVMIIWIWDLNRMIIRSRHTHFLGEELWLANEFEATVAFELMDNDHLEEMIEQWNTKIRHSIDSLDHQYIVTLAGVVSILNEKFGLEDDHLASE